MRETITRQGILMAIGKRKKPKQHPLWIAHSDLASRSGQLFCTRLNCLRDDDGFDVWLGQECAPHFSEIGPSFDPARGLLPDAFFAVHLEGFDSERLIV